MKIGKPRRFRLLVPVSCFAIAAFFSCKNQPESPSPAAPAPPLPRPEAALAFDHIEASNPDTLDVHLTIRVTNPRNEGAAVTVKQARFFVNNAEHSRGFGFEAEAGRVTAGGNAEIRAVYRLNMNELVPSASAAANAALVGAKSALSLGFAFDGGAHSSACAEAAFEFPRIREPRFSIVSIAVMQAELINTRFKVKLKIQNPNPFPLTLSSFRYELYGSGRLWAEGRKKNVCEIPGNGDAEENLFIVMNFIDMRRDLLDQVIMMRDISYRFTGEAEIGTGITYLPNFTAGFDLEGFSGVLR